VTDSIQIQPAKAFNAVLTPPGSKSLTNRALLIGALAEGVTELSGVLFADDTLRMIEALGALGFKLDVDREAERVSVHGLGGVIPAKKADLDLGNAGTAIRFLTAALCLGKGTYTLDGIERMRERPIGELVEPLRELGAEIEYLGEDGYPPLRIKGNGGEDDGFNGGFITLKPTISSQFISALLIAAPLTERGITISFDGPITSLPYIKMTLKLMEHFGIEHAWGGPSGRSLRVSHGDYKAKAYAIEPDASSASYFLAAAAVVPGSTCTITNLGSESVQGDAEFCDILGLMGCNVTQRLTSTTVSAPTEGRLKGIDIRMHRMPDMAQTLATIALFADGPTTIRKVANLRVKETDRLAALDAELSKFGAHIEAGRGTIRVTPPAGNDLTPAIVETYDDHRMAMAFSVIGLSAPAGTVTIQDPGCVSKTFPDYWDSLQMLHNAALDVGS